MHVEVLPGENEKSFLYRVGSAKAGGLLSATWDEIARVGNAKFHSQTPLQADSYRRRFGKMRDKIDNALRVDPATYERKLFENVEAETFWEEGIQHALENLESLPRPRVIPDQALTTGEEYVLAFGDCHFGYEFDVKNLFGESINAYSEEIFYERMEKLLNRTRAICVNNHVKKLSVIELGDSIHGILRLNSSLMNLKYGVVESAVKYGCYLADWLNTLSESVKVEYHPVMDSNHNQIRVCSDKKNAFPEENVSKIINTIVELRLADNPNFTMVKNPTGYAWLNLCGYNILGHHGEIRNLERGINELEDVYGAKINYLVCGHTHHKTQSDVTVDSEVMTVRSVMGTDPYGLSLRKSCSPGASLFGFRKNEGKFVEYNIDLR